MKTHLEHLSSNMGSLQGKHVLDLGAGTGSFLIDLTKSGVIATGLEYNPRYIQKAEEKAAGAGISIDMREGKAEALPFEDNSFDAANASEVIEHVQDPSKMLSELYRVLKPEGMAYMSVPNRFSMRDPHFHLYFVNWLPRSLSDTYIGMLGKHKDYDHLEAGHQRLSEMHYYRYGVIIRLVESKGFKAQDIRALRIKNMRPSIKKILLRLLYPLARTLYFDSYHLLLTKKV